MKPNKPVPLVALALLCAFDALAQTNIPVYQLDPIERPDISEGKAAFVQGEVGSTPDRFYLGNLYMLKPISVTVRAVNPGDVVNVKLTKFRWEDVLREGSTGVDTSQVQFKFRTHDEFQISLTGNKPATPYKMVVWVGPDMKPNQPPLVVPRSQFSGGESSLTWWIGGIGATIVIGALVFFFVKRKRV